MTLLDIPFQRQLLIRLHDGDAGELVMGGQGAAGGKPAACGQGTRQDLGPQRGIYLPVERVSAVMTEVEGEHDGIVA